MSADENIRVVARFRPPSAREAGSAQKFRFGHDGRSVSLSGDDATAFALDQVLPPEATQDDTYQHVSAIVEAVLQGYNGTILAYGQTGSGKTHSVTGSSADPGLLPRAVARIFEHVCDDTSGSEFIISCSYLEIYKEVVRDLLQPHGAGAKAGGLSIREGSSKSCKGVFVEGLSQVYVTSEADVLECLECGNANRIIGSTLMNAQSSRSHALLTLTLRQQLSDGTVRVSKLNVADLAGSEKVSKTGAKGETLEEAKKINTSLSALCLVISALADARPHVPYRNSKLTRILQESLGGNSKTLLLVACSPSADNESETKSTLQFATRAKTIRNAAVVNTLLSQEQLQEQADRLRSQLKAARAEVERLRRGEVALGSTAQGGTVSNVVDESEARAWREALSGPAEADGLRAELTAAREAVEALQEELNESARTVSELEEALRRRDDEAEELHDMLERVQVLHGVAPKRRSSSDKRSSRDGIDALRRIVVEVESARLRAELEGTDDEAEMTISGLRSQLAEQHERIVELEALAARGRRADAAEAEIVQLKEQLQALASAKLEAVGAKQRRKSVMPLASFGRLANSTPLSSLRVAVEMPRCSTAGGGIAPPQLNEATPLSLGRMVSTHGEMLVVSAGNADIHIVGGQESVVPTSPLVFEGISQPIPLSSTLSPCVEEHSPNSSEVSADNYEPTPPSSTPPSSHGPSRTGSFASGVSIAASNRLCPTPIAAATSSIDEGNSVGIGTKGAELESVIRSSPAHESLGATHSTTDGPYRDSLNHLQGSIPDRSISPPTAPTRVGDFHKNVEQAISDSHSSLAKIDPLQACEPPVPSPTRRKPQSPSSQQCSPNTTLPPSETEEDNIAWPILVEVAPEPPKEIAFEPDEDPPDKRFEFVDTSRGRSRSKRSSHRRTVARTTNTAFAREPLPVVEEQGQAVIANALDAPPPPLPPPIPPDACRSSVDAASPPLPPAAPPPPPDAPLQPTGSSPVGPSFFGKQSADAQKHTKGKGVKATTHVSNENYNPQERSIARPRSRIVKADISSLAPSRAR